MWYFSTLEQCNNSIDSVAFFELYHTGLCTLFNQKIPHWLNSYTIQSKIPHWYSFWIGSKNTTLFRTVTQSNQKILHCSEQLYNPIKKCNCQNSYTIWFKKYHTVQNSYTIQSENVHCSEQLHNPIGKYHTVLNSVHNPIGKYLFWQCGIFWLDCITVLSVWYFLIALCNCSVSVVFVDWIV